MSLNLCTDQLIVELAPEQIVGITTLARDPSLSAVAIQAASLPTVRADAEAVLQLKPDLVLAGPYGAQTTLALLRNRGVPVLQLDEPESFADIARQIRDLARILGVPERGEKSIAHMQAQLAAIPPPTHPRAAILWQARGWTAGPGSLGDAVLKAAGLRNLGTGGQIGIEKLLALKPDLLITETNPAYPSLATDLARHPSLKNLARRHVPPAKLLCGGPYTAEIAQALATPP